MEYKFVGTKSPFIICVCLLVLLGTASADPTDNGDKLVLAGERIGHVKLNMDLAELHRMFGEPTTSENAMGGRGSETWCSNSLNGQLQQTIVNFFGAADADGKRKQYIATRVTVTSPFFHTPAGVSTKSEPDAIWREFPDLRYQESGKTKDGVPVELYDSVTNGVGFVMERVTQPKAGEPWGRCCAIVVFPRGEQIGVPYLGDCEPVR